MGPEIFAGGGLVLTLVIVCGSVLCTLVITAAAIAIPFYLIRNNRKRAQELMTKGIPGEATILSLKDTGMRINDDPRVTVVLDIRMPNMAPYQVTKSVTIPLINLSQVQTGSVVAIVVDLFDPTNPDKIGLLLK